MIKCLIENIIFTKTGGKTIKILCQMIGIKNAKMKVAHMIKLI